MAKIEFLIHPLVKEILEQQRMILEMHKALLAVLSSKPLLVHEHEPDK